MPSNCRCWDALLWAPALHTQLLDADSSLAKEMLYSLSKEVFRMSK
jgi:hypothetical protein